jgi:hypothetical protein
VLAEHGRAGNDDVSVLVSLDLDGGASGRPLHADVRAERGCGGDDNASGLVSLDVDCGPGRFILDGNVLAEHGCGLRDGVSNLARLSFHDGASCCDFTAELPELPSVDAVEDEITNATEAAQDISGTAEQRGPGALGATDGHEASLTDESSDIASRDGEREPGPISHDLCRAFVQFRGGFAGEDGAA